MTGTLECTVIPASHNSGSLTRGYTISSLDHLVSTSVPGGDEALQEHCLSSFHTHFLTVYHCADQELFHCDKPTLKHCRFSHCSRQQRMLQPPTASLSSWIWQEKRALPPNACCSSSLLPARTRDSVPRREVIALETSLNICVQSGRTCSPGGAPAVARSLGRGCAPPGAVSGAAPGPAGLGLRSGAATDGLQNKTTALQKGAQRYGAWRAKPQGWDFSNYKPGKLVLVL